MADEYIPKFEDTEDVVPAFEDTIDPSEAPARPGMNFTPDPTAQAVRLANREQGEFVPPPELQQAVTNDVAGVVQGFTNDAAPVPEGVEPTLRGNIMGGIAQAAVLPQKKAFDAASGAMQGFNTTEGSIPKKLIGGLFGAGLSLAGGAAGKGLAKGVETLAKGASKVATSAEKSLDKLALGIRQGDVLKFARKGKKLAADSTEDVVEILKKEGIFNRGASPEALEQSLEEIRHRAATNLENTFSQIDASGHVLPSKELLGVLDQELSRLKQFPEGFSDKISRLESFRNDISLMPEANASQLRTMTQIVADEAFDRSGMVVDNEAFKVWQSLKDATDTLADSVGGDLGNSLKESNKVYATTQKALPAIARKAAGQEAGKGLIKQGKELLDDSASKLTRGSVAWVTKNADKLSKVKIYGPILHGAASRGPQALAAAYYRLSQSDPAFNEAIKGLDDE